MRIGKSILSNRQTNLRKSSNYFPEILKQPNTDNKKSEATINSAYSKFKMKVFGSPNTDLDRQFITKITNFKKKL
jgi:hypothetical protein